MRYDQWLKIVNPLGNMSWNMANGHVTNSYEWFWKKPWELLIKYLIILIKSFGCILYIHPGTYYCSIFIYIKYLDSMFSINFEYISRCWKISCYRYLPFFAYHPPLNFYWFNVLPLPFFVLLILHDMISINSIMKRFF